MRERNISSKRDVSENPVENSTSEKRNIIKSFVKSHFKANPLSYLGWFGILGGIGLIFIPVFIPFLLFFSFFAYEKVVPDELFWKNVNRACTRGFWAVFGLDTGIAVILFLRGMTIGRKNAWVEAVIEENLITMGTFTYDQYAIAFLAFFGSITLMILVFTISMLQFKKQEKKMLETE